MTNAEMTLIDTVTLETTERRKKMEHQDRAFVAQLRAAILAGLETPSGVLGHQHGPREPRRDSKRARFHNS